MVRSIAACLVALAVLTAHASAQQPDFSGIWVLDPARSDERVCGQLRVISQTPTQIDMTVFQVASGQTSLIPVGTALRSLASAPRPIGQSRSCSRGGRVAIASSL